MVGNYMVDLSNLPTDLLVKELENRRENGDVLFAAVYTKETIKDRLCNIGSAEDIALGRIDNKEFIDECFNAIDKDELQYCFQKWENGEGSVYDKITDVVDYKFNCDD